MSLAGRRPGARRGFRRRWANQHASLHFGPNMTPMVDVVMVILVFFMASAAFLGPEWFLKSLVPRPAKPGAGEAQPLKTDPFALPPVQKVIELEFDPSGRTLATGLGKERLDIAAMIAAVAAFAEGTAKDQLEIIIKPAAQVPYRDVIRLHEGCEKIGIGRVGLATP